MKLPLARLLWLNCTAVIRPVPLILIIILYLAAMTTALLVPARVTTPTLIGTGFVAALLIWFPLSTSNLACARQLRELRVPGENNLSRWAVFCAALLTFGLPTLIGFIKGCNLALIFPFLCATAAAGVLWGLLPMPWMICVFMAPGLLNQLARRSDLHLWNSLSTLAPPESLACLATVVLGALAAARWRQLLLRAELNLGFGGSIAEKAVVMSALWSSRVTDSTLNARVTSNTWLMPHYRARASDAAARRIGVLLGPPYAPGFIRQLLMVFVLVLAIVLPVTLLSSGPFTLARLWIVLRQLP
ncbi:MAG: hypothetical protein QM718_00160 [Steroidobacteraceae bacterium]